MDPLRRFKDAQDGSGAGFATALAEIRGGGKRSHWIWYVFPQLAGLGSSRASQTYGINGLPEAEAYLRDPVLGERLITITAAVADALGRHRSVTRLMGSRVDAQKLVSSMTLFEGVARNLDAVDETATYAPFVATAREILAAAADEGYPRCEFTDAALRKR